MDELAEGCGRLSTNAKEWKPSIERQVQVGISNAAVQSHFLPSTRTSETVRTSMMQQTPPGSNLRASPQTELSWQVDPRHGWDTMGGSRDLIDHTPENSWKSLGKLMREDEVHSSPTRYNPLKNGEEPVPRMWQSASSAVAPTTPRLRSFHSMGLSDMQWRQYREISLEARKEMDESDQRHKAIPQPFTNAYPLNDSRTARSAFGYPTSVFRVTSTEDGHLYCLWRVDNVRSVSSKIAAVVTERWTSAATATGSVSLFNHSAVVPLYRCFVANRAVFFVYQYFAGARNLREYLFDHRNGVGFPLPEATIWSCITQLVAAIRVVHSCGLACRAMRLQHILCMPSNSGWRSSSCTLRLRLNCLGVVDALEFETRKTLADLQSSDMRDLGYLIFSLATGTEVTASSDPNSLRRCDMFLAQHYSHELHNLVIQLMNTPRPSIFELSSTLTIHLFNELDASFAVADHHDSALQTEFESSRSLRLLVKLGFVNDRPEFGINSRWSESGDCYILKLFRDYVFHQADGAGNPVMDLGHVVSALNKLDAADEEKICLSSREGKSVVVVSFAEVARCLDRAYRDLCAGSVQVARSDY